MRSKFILILMGSVFCISSSFAMETHEKERSNRPTPFPSSKKSQLMQYLEEENYDSAQGYCDKKSREFQQQAERQQDSTKLEISALFRKASRTLGTCSHKQFEQLKSTGFEGLLKDISPYLMEDNIPFTDQDIQMFDVSCLRYIKEGLKSSPQKSLNSSSEKSEQQSSTDQQHMEAYAANTERLIGLIDEMMPFVARKNIADMFSQVERLDVYSSTSEVSLLISPYVEEIMHCGQVLRCSPTPIDPQELSKIALHVKKYFKENCPHALSATVRDDRFKVPKEEFLRHAELFFSFQQETPHFQLLEATSTSAAEMFKEEQDRLKPQKLPQAYKEIYIAIMRNYLGGDENLWERTRNWTFVAYVKMLYQRFVEKAKK